MSAPLPGMPMRAGDPGVFACGPDDIAPWERERPRAVPSPPRRTAPPALWLVLNICPACNPRTRRYCSNHDEWNWWLTTMGNWARKRQRA